MDTIFVVSEIALAGLVFIFNLLKLSNAISLCFATSFVMLIMYLIFCTKSRKINKYLFLLISLSILNITINYLLSRSASFSFDYIKKIIFFMTSVLFFEISTKVDVSEKGLTWIKRIIIILGIFLVFDYFILGNRTMYGRYLTLGFSNPNFTAMWLLHIVLFVVYYFASNTSAFVKLICAAIAGVCIYLIILTQNRSAFVVLVYFVVLVLMFWRKHQLNRITLLGTLLFPLIVYLFYQAIVSNNFINKMLSFMVSEGKGLDSRATVWNFATEKIVNGGWFLGDYAGISDGTGSSQLHNSHVDILASYGIVPFVLFLKFMWCIIVRVNDGIDSLYGSIAFICFLSIIILGTFEAGIFSGCTGLNYFTGAFLILSKNTRK